MLYKDTVEKIIKTGSVTELELNKFIIDYVKQKKNIEVSTQELNEIKQLISVGIFSFDHAIQEAIKDLKLQVTTITNKNGQILRRDVSE